jgi:hypothetical protein
VDPIERSVHTQCGSSSCQNFVLHCFMYIKKIAEFLKKAVFIYTGTVKIKAIAFCGFK